MCGIVGYVGPAAARNILVEGLEKLEYRGYDSAGVALPDGAGGIEIVCRAGKVSELASALSDAAQTAINQQSTCSVNPNQPSTPTSQTNPEEATLTEGAPSLANSEGAGLEETGLQSSSERTSHEESPLQANPEGTSLTEGATSQADSSEETRPAVNLAAALEARCGIAHTRWATHGRPTEANAHPHSDCTGQIAVVHNGIIENYAQLREELLAAGHTFQSETDTETVAHLLETYYEGDLAAAMFKAAARLKGAYGLAAIHAAHPDEIVVTRKDSPIVVGCTQQAALVASDMVALMNHTRDVVFLEDGQLAVLRAGRIQYFDAPGHEVAREPTHITWDTQTAERAGFPDFMLKEIYEQPRVVRDTMAGRYVPTPEVGRGCGRIVLEELGLSAEELAAIDHVCILACGTSYHAGLVARELIEKWARIPVAGELASEQRYRDAIVSPRTLVLAISQSGETADTLAAVRKMRAAGAKVFAITNCMGSRLTRESDGTLYVKANMEISVAATKSFLAQLVCVTLLALFLAQEKGTLGPREIGRKYRELRKTSPQIEKILADTSAVEAAVEVLENAASAMFVGRGISAPVCFEGALKLKEISYLHAEAYSAGELKHGPIALIDERLPVVAVVTQSPTREKTISNIEEVLARGARVVAVATEGDVEIARIAEHVIYIPAIDHDFSAITATVPLQLLAREVALARGCNVDQPRNLAKSVTVE